MLMRNRVLHRRRLRSEARPRCVFILARSFCWKLLVLADAQASALSVGGFGALGSQRHMRHTPARKLDLAGE